ncbi:glycosyltransferase family 2 protein [Magnetococcus sp. PR-3]|uniref:glycosyltransferase family 2 protein n=1 Tax=Magnetococcus sp. PR-3 TaxID=3120355 RepID=UPI002FCE1173
MNTAPMVSILMPNFNGEHLVAQTLDSLLAQTETRWECVIVDDGSSDKSPEIIQNYVQQDPRFGFMKRHREPKGACTCRNIGLDHTTAPYVMFLDNDDLLEPFALANRLQTMQANPELDFAIFPSVMFEHTPHDLRRWWNIPNNMDLLMRQCVHDSVCQGTGPLFTRQAFDRLGRWNESLLLWQDIHLFFQAYSQDYSCKVFWDLPPDLHNRCNPNSLSRGNFLAPGKQISRKQVIEQAIESMLAHDKAAYLPYMDAETAEVIQGLKRAKLSDEAQQLRKLARDKGVFTRQQYHWAGVVLVLWSAVRFRVPFAQFCIRQLIKQFHRSSRMCEVSYDEFPCPGHPPEQS